MPAGLPRLRFPGRRFDGPAGFKARWKRGPVIGPAHLPAATRRSVPSGFSHEPAPPETAEPSPVQETARAACDCLAGGFRVQSRQADCRRRPAIFVAVVSAGFGWSRDHLFQRWHFLRRGPMGERLNKRKPSLAVASVQVRLEQANTVARSAACVIACASAFGLLHAIAGRITAEQRLGFRNRQRNPPVARIHSLEQIKRHWLRWAVLSGQGLQHSARASRKKKLPIRFAWHAAVPWIDAGQRRHGRRPGRFIAAHVRRIRRGCHDTQ